ncbi:2132_t:CDS:2, partial [Diversispora eburnea]
MSDHNEKYPGYEKLTSYLSRYENKSFWGFLLCCRDTIVNITSATAAGMTLTTPGRGRGLTKGELLGMTA